MKYRDSQPRTRPGIGIGLATLRCPRLGLGLGPGVLALLVSVSESGLEHWDSGKSTTKYGYLKKLFKYFVNLLSCISC